MGEPAIKKSTFKLHHLLESKRKQTKKDHLLESGFHVKEKENERDGFFFKSTNSRPCARKETPERQPWSYYFKHPVFPLSSVVSFFLTLLFQELLRITAVLRRRRVSFYFLASRRSHPALVRRKKDDIAVWFFLIGNLENTPLTSARDANQGQGHLLQDRRTGLGAYSRVDAWS